MESVAILKKALDSLQNEIIRADTELTAYKESVKVTEEKIKNLVLRASHLELSISNLVQSSEGVSNASKSKKTKR